MKCFNCYGNKEVPTVIPCPVCVGNGVSELIALRQLHTWCLNNIKSRSKPSKEMVELVNFVLQAQGKKTI